MIILAPPPIKPSEPGLSAFAAAQLMRRMGGRARAIDASMGWHRYVLNPQRLAAQLQEQRALGLSDVEAKTFARALRSVGQARPLHQPATYQDRKVYTSAVNHLEQALRLVARPYPGVQLRVAQIEVERPGLRAESSIGLAQVADLPGPCDEYFVRELVPAIAQSGARKVGISLTFQPQTPVAVRWATLLREHLPHVERILAGPLVACWKTAGTPLTQAPFDRFDRILAGDDDDVAMLARETAADMPGELPDDLPEAPLSVDLAGIDWSHYLGPLPTVPAVLGRGCYWRHCTFCPDHLHPRLLPTDRGGMEGWLHQLAERFPGGAMIHFTDSALPPAHLGRVADVIARDRLPLQWRGFVRCEKHFADPAFAARLAQGGCAMLQLGIETGSERILELLGKGTGDPQRSRRVLQVLGDAGIRNYVYLLFGVPTETDDDREQTLSLVEEEGHHIHALNLAILNLPRGSPMWLEPARFGITRVQAFHVETDLSLYDDFFCGDEHPRTQARRWLDRRFAKSPAVRRIGADFRSPFKENHVWAL
ncbi:MAG: radical SAM protein [Deltaproteobacteria bacterium]|nr:radical SAM protein [Deltaproteobacteria bacterium]